MIKTFDYLKLLPEIEEEVTAALHRVLRSGCLILGPETAAFEEEFADFVGARHCVAVTSGTAALHLSLMALGVGPGHEVITVSNTCAPTIAAIRLTGATPVFVDVREEDLLLDAEALAARIGERTRAIVPVHLWGHSVRMERVLEIAQRHGVPVVEDCAQATGTEYQGRHVGNFGELGCFSFYPTKNLGAYGDAGAIVTQNVEHAARLKALRMYGYQGSAVSSIEGTNARIAEFQAAILRVKLRVLPPWLARRRRIASLYDDHVRNPAITLPPRGGECVPSYHQYVIRCRSRQPVTEALAAAGIGFGVHYPVPVHLMPAYAFLGCESLKLPVTERASHKILSLPIHEALTKEEALEVARILNHAQAAG